MKRLLRWWESRLVKVNLSWLKRFRWSVTADIRSNATCIIQPKQHSTDKSGITMCLAIQLTLSWPNENHSQINIPYDTTITGRIAIMTRTKCNHIAVYVTVSGMSGNDNYYIISGSKFDAKVHNFSRTFYERLQPHNADWCKATTIPRNYLPSHSATIWRISVPIIIHNTWMY